MIKPSILARLTVSFALAIVSYSSVLSQEGGFLNLDGDSLYYETAGDGFPLVFVAGGSSMDTRQWTRVWPALSDDFQVVLVDPRGIGKSDNPTASYSEAADLAALLDHLGLEQVVFFGLSSAGGAVLEFALRFPERTAGVMASAPFVPGFQFNDDMQARLRRISEAAERGTEPFLDAMFADPYFIPAPTDKSIRSFARPVMAETFDKGAGFDPALVEELSPPVIERLEEIKAPVLLLVGVLDHPEVLRRNRLFAERVPNATEASVENAGHNPHLENPDGFLKAIEPFLANWKTDKESESTSSEPVWAVDFIKTLPGGQEVYLRNIKSNWAQARDVATQRGVILSYQALATEPDSARGWDVILITEYTDTTAWADREEAFSAIFESPEFVRVQQSRPSSQLREFFGSTVTMKNVAPR